MEVCPVCFLPAIGGGGVSAIVVGRLKLSSLVVIDLSLDISPSTPRSISSLERNDMTECVLGLEHETSRGTTAPSDPDPPATAAPTLTLPSLVDIDFSSRLPGDL